MSLFSALFSALRARSGLLAVSGGAVLWGTTGVAVSIIHERSGLGAVPIGCYRLAIAALVLAGAVRWTRALALFRRHRWGVVWSGAGLGAYQALYFVGVQDVGVSVSTLVSLAIAPVAITLATAVSRRRMPSTAALLTLACAIGGLALISFAAGSGHAAPHPVVGVLASLGSGLGYAATTVLNRRLAAEGDPVTLTAVTSAVGAIVLLPVALPVGMAAPRDAVALGWLVYIGVVSTVVAYSLFYVGLRTITSEAAGVLTLLEPLTAALLATALLHERLDAAGLCGAVLLLVAIAGMYARRPEPEVPAL